jgi:hypothetical protein
VTPEEVTAAAGTAAEAVRSLNHTVRPGAAQIDAELDASDVYDLLAELTLMTSRMPQLLRQLEATLDQLVEAGDVVIVDGPNVGDPAAVAAITGHWLAAAAGAAHELAHRVNAAQQALAYAARPDRASS